MKKDIHPKYYPQAKVTCACGNTFTTGSTQAEIRVEICAKCHPFFTGEAKYVDSGGRVKRFEEWRQKAQENPHQKKGKKKITSQTSPASLKEMLEKSAKNG